VCVCGGGERDEKCYFQLVPLFVSAAYITHNIPIWWFCLSELFPLSKQLFKSRPWSYCPGLSIMVQYFFSHNKSANSTFQSDFSAKRTWLSFVYLYYVYIHTYTWYVSIYLSIYYIIILFYIISHLKKL
jgi:hypothetical protein